MANNITLSYPSAFHHQFLDRNGKPLTGGKLYTYSAGTSTSIPTYKTIGDTSSTNTNTNPIILDNAGVAHIVIETDKAYKFVLFDKNDAKIAEWDNVTGNIGGGGGCSEDIVVVGTPNEIDVSGSVIQGVKRYVVSLSNSVKITILQLIGLYNNVLNSLGNKADKVQGATAGNFASLDANGNLTDSGSKVADFKTKQTPVADPSASGVGLEFIDSVSQDANGEITPHKKSVQDGTTTQKGVVKLSNAIDSTSATEAATPKAVKDAYDELNNKIVARAVFLSQAEWAVQSQLAGDPAKVYYVENGTGEDAYTVYVWKESTSTYEEVDESSIDLDGYWHDGPTTTGNGNVVTNITLGNDGVPQVEKGLTALTQHQSVTDNDPTLAWSTRSKVGTIGGTDLHVTMPSNPASGKLDTTGDASNTTSTFTKASGDTSSMTSGGKMSAIFTAISSFFASLKALAFKDKVSDSDINGTISDSHIASASTWNGKQNALGINSSSGDTGKFLNERGAFATPNYPSVPSVINNLTSNSTTDALSAAQGKALDGKKVDNATSDASNNGTTKYKFLCSITKNNVSNALYAGYAFYLCWRDDSNVNTTGEGIVSFSCSEHSRNDIVGKIVILNTRGGNLIPNDARIKIFVKVSGENIELWSYSVGWSDVFCRYIGGSVASISYPNTLSDTAPSGNYTAQLPFVQVPYSLVDGKGSTTTPVYVKSDGTVDACSTSDMSVGTASYAEKTKEGCKGSNTATLYIAGYTDNNIPYYHVKDIKNGCVNHVNFSGITNSTCDITFEAPTLSTGEEYDYIISLEGYTNNSGYSTGAYVENCKQILHYISDGNVWVGEGLFLQATDWRQICIVRGNTCEWKRVALS